SFPRISRRGISRDGPRRGRRREARGQKGRPYGCPGLDDRGRNAEPRSIRRARTRNPLSCADMSLRDQSIVVGITGGIAAYKAVELLRELGRRGARIRAVMSRSATRFVGPITLTGLIGESPVVDLWDPSYKGEVHIELGEWADAMIVAPATMQ